MYRNALEKINRFSPAKFISMPYLIVTCLIWNKIIDRYNYRDYIKINSILSSPLKKVLPEIISLEGACERKNGLFLSFQTWLYFNNYQNIHKQQPTRLYSTSYSLVIFLAGWL